MYRRLGPKFELAGQVEAFLHESQLRQAVGARQLLLDTCETLLDRLGSPLATSSRLVGSKGIEIVANDSALSPALR